MKRRYDQAFRREAIRLALTGEKSIAQTARDLGIKEGVLYSWINKAKQSSEECKDGDRKLTAAELIKELTHAKKRNYPLKENMTEYGVRQLITIS